MCWDGDIVPLQARLTLFQLVFFCFRFIRIKRFFAFYYVVFLSGIIWFPEFE